MSNEINNDLPLVAEIKLLIEESKQRVAVTVNAKLTLLYWTIGKRINKEILGNERPEFGNQVVKSLSDILTDQYGNGWSIRQLYHCIKVAEVFPNNQIVHTLCAQLSWSHLRLIIAIEEPLKRTFYTTILQFYHRNNYCKRNCIRQWKLHSTK